MARRDQLGSRQRRAIGASHRIGSQRGELASLGRCPRCLDHAVGPDQRTGNREILGSGVRRIGIDDADQVFRADAEGQLGAEFGRVEEGFRLTCRCKRRSAARIEHEQRHLERLGAVARLCRVDRDRGRVPPRLERSTCNGETQRGGRGGPIQGSTQPPGACGVGNASNADTGELVGAGASNLDCLRGRRWSPMEEAERDRLGSEVESCCTARAGRVATTGRDEQT
jgi:hypothetical protein